MESAGSEAMFAWAPGIPLGSPCSKEPFGLDVDSSRTGKTVEATDTLAYHSGLECS